MENEDTPFPWTWYWKLSDNSNHNLEADCGIVSGAETRQAISVCRAPRYALEVQWKENAAFIVEACNNYKALKAQNEALLSELRNMLNLFDRVLPVGSISDYACKSARTAISQAEGKGKP